MAPVRPGAASAPPEHFAKPRPLKVLLVGKGAPDRGGIPTFLQTLRNSALADSYQLRFLNVAHFGTPEGGKATAGNVWRTLRDVFRVWRAARGCDIVHIHSALAPAVTVVRAGLLALPGRLRGCGVIVHAHGGMVEFWLTSPFRRLLMRLAMRPAHRVVAVWTTGERALRDALGPGRVELIDNGVDLATHTAADGIHRPPRVLYVGLLTARKGVLDLVEASRLLRERGVAHELLLLGGTPDEGPAAETPVRAAAAGHARLLGTRPPEDMPAAYAGAEVFCLPSWWEAMPLAVLEAMAHGLPVVATEVGDVPRAIEHGTTGYVVPSRSAPALADALAPLLTDQALRRRMGAAGRARVEEMFSSAVTAGSVSRLYGELASQRR